MAEPKPTDQPELIADAQPVGLTTRELAEKLGRTAQSVRNWVDEGMPYLEEGQRSGNPYRFDEQACRKWLAANKAGFGRGGTREGAGRPKKKRKAKATAWRAGDGPLIDEAERRQRVNERVAELAGTAAAEAALDPDVLALESDRCKLTPDDLVLLAYLEPSVSGMTKGALERLEKLEGFYKRRMERLKAQGELVPAREVRQAAQAMLAELRTTLEAGARGWAERIAGELGLDGEAHQRVERLLVAKVREAVEGVHREVGAEAA